MTRDHAHAFKIETVGKGKMLFFICFFLIQMISWLDWQLEELIFKNQTSVPDRIEPFPEASEEIPRKIL